MLGEFGFTYNGPSITDSIPQIVLEYNVFGVRGGPNTGCMRLHVK